MASERHCQFSREARLHRAKKMKGLAPHPWAVTQPTGQSLNLNECVWGKGIPPPPRGASNLQPVLRHASAVSAQNWLTGELCGGVANTLAKELEPVWLAALLLRPLVSPVPLIVEANSGTSPNIPETSRSTHLLVNPNGICGIGYFVFRPRTVKRGSRLRTHPVDSATPRSGQRR